ncbi:hypothetical protein PIB30_107382, partial [Stylosanthes scabra]|nr:hypothetical protein [Stylosanthes scabra]
FIPQQPNIKFLADAYATPEGKLRLTKKDGNPVTPSFGAAFHCSPAHIWDSRETNKLASFFTCFSFTIYAGNVTNTADMLAFVLAPVGKLPNSMEQYRELFNVGAPSKAVAVEFHTDTQDRSVVLHTGSTQKEKSWEFQNEKEFIVYMSYDNTSSNLKATWVDPNEDPDSVTDSVNLTSVLPEWVSVGFCGQNGNSDTVEVNSSYFASGFEDYPLVLAERLWALDPHLASHMSCHFRSSDE